jgi:ParB family chromosome partitioning protein
MTATLQEAPPPRLRILPLLPADPAGCSLMLPVTAIDPNPWRPRFSQAAPGREDDLRLTASIAREGVRENLLVRPAAAGRYQLLVGDRRLRCAMAAGRAEVPAIVRALDDRQARVFTLGENLRRERLHFLDEADAVAGLVEEDWTYQEIAAHVRQPLSWAARRHRLMNLTPAWRQLAENPRGFVANWSAADFEEIAILEPDSQTDLLTRSRHRLERCATVRELARLIRSLTPAITSFPWSPDDPDLHPLAGACGSCPHRSSRHPGLLDARAGAEQPRGPSTPRTCISRGTPDRCLDPVCAAKKAQLFLERRVAQLAAKYPRVLLLQSGWLPRDVPGALRDWEVTEAAPRSRAALPAVVANGPDLGRLRWVKLADPLAFRARPTPAPGPPRRPSPAERQARACRRRRIHAIGLLKAALLRHAPPDLSTSVRLAIVFGTAQTNASAAYTRDAELPLLTPGTDLARERRRMLGCDLEDESENARDFFPAAGSTPRSPTRLPAAPLVARQAIAGNPGPDRPPTLDHLSEAAAPLLPPAAVASLAAAGARGHAAGRFWQAFDALAGNDRACAELLWARTLRVLLYRMTPTGDPRQADIAWNEALRIAALVGLDVQALLDQAEALLPSPRARREPARPA